MKFFWICLGCSAMLLLSCKKDNCKRNPACIDSQIALFLSQPVGTECLQIDAYQYRNQTMYLFGAGCCDWYNVLKDEQCNSLGSPSGGITGKGDFSLPGFADSAVFIQTIWRDPRQ